MPLVSMKPMLRAALDDGYPVKCYRHQALVAWMGELAASSPVPVVLHLDHGRDLEMINSR
jgi:hypothetical protein